MIAARIDPSAAALPVSRADLDGPPSMSVMSSVSRAEQLDRAGRHAEAVDCLVAGVHRDEVESTTQLGKRLLAGDRAPLLPREGFGLLRDAATAGGAEAPSLLAVCQLVGLLGPCDANAARDALLLSARRGWSPAQQQLRVLAEDDTGSTDWTALAARIDLDHWRRPPAALTLHDDPLICSLPSFASPRVCRWLMQRARGHLSPALVYHAGRRATMPHPARTNSAAVLGLLETDVVGALVQMRIAASVGQPFRHLEAATVLHYAPGEQVREHYDFVDPNVPDYEAQLRERGQRTVTFLLYLNDDYEDGRTEFPRLGLSHKGRCGEGFFFVNAFADGRPDERTLHAGRPPSGTPKWIVSQFIKNRPAF